MTSKRFREIRLLAPVVACWCVLLYVLIYLDIGLDKRGPSSWRDSLLIATSGIGMWMAVVWLSLYWRTRWIPIFLLFLLVAIVLSAIHYYTHPRGRELDVFIVIGVCPFIASMVGLVPLVLVRRLSGWQIIDDTDSMEMAQPQFSRKGMFFLAVIFAAVCVAVAWADIPEKLSMLMLVGMVIPITCGMFLLFTMSNVRVRYTWPMALVLGALAAASPMLVSGRPVSRSGTLFVTTFGAYLYAACLLLLAASYLRLRGVLFRFGGTSGFAARRDRLQKAPSFAKLFVRSAFIFLLVFLILSACLSVWRFRASRQAQAKLSSIDESGLPTTPTEAREYYESLQDSPDVTSEWRKTLGSLEDAQFKVDYGELFEGADLFPYWGHGKQDLSEDVERLAAFIAKYSTLLDQLHSTAQKEGYVDFLDFGEGNYSPEFNKLRTVARLLACDAVVDINQGDAKGFMESVEDIFQIGHLIDNDAVLIAQITRLHLLSYGLNVIHHSLSRIQLPLETSSSLRSKIGELGYFAAFRQGLIGERAIMTSSFRDVKQWQYADKVSGWLRLQVKFNAPSDLCVYLDCMEKMVYALEQRPAEAWKIAKSVKDFDHLAQEAWLMPRITLTVVPAFDAALVDVCRNIFIAEACRASLAVEVYRMKHKQIPASLQDLVPKFIESVPTDPFDGEPLRFQRWDGGYRVYSTGPNAIDDHGFGKNANDFDTLGTEPESRRMADDYGFEVPRPARRVDTGEAMHPANGYSGLWQVFWPNGQPKYKMRYIEGKRHGRCVAFSKPVSEGSTGYGAEMGSGYGSMGEGKDLDLSVVYGDTMLADGTFKDDEPFEGTFSEWNGDEPTIVRYQDGERLGP